MKNTVINTTTIKEYDELMKIYEAKGWTWNGWDKPTSYNIWNIYQQDTCISYKNKFWYAGIDFCKRNGEKILTFKEFKEMENKETFTRGELVEVRDEDSNEWTEKIYLTTIEWAKYPYIVVEHYEAEKFKSWKIFDTDKYKQIRKLNTTIPEYTMEELFKKIGEEFKLIK